MLRTCFVIIITTFLLGTSVLADSPRMLWASHDSFELVLHFDNDNVELPLIDLFRSSLFSDRTAPLMQLEMRSAPGQPRIPKESFLVKTPFTNFDFVAFGGGAKVFERGTSESWFVIRVPEEFAESPAGKYQFRIWLPGYDWEFFFTVNVEPFVNLTYAGPNPVEFLVVKPGRYDEDFTYTVQANVEWLVSAQFIEPLTPTVKGVASDRVIISPELFEIALVERTAGHGREGLVGFDSECCMVIHKGFGSEVVTQQVVFDNTGQLSAVQAGTYRGAIMLTVSVDE